MSKSAMVRARIEPELKENNDMFENLDFNIFSKYSKMRLQINVTKLHRKIYQN